MQLKRFLMNEEGGSPGGGSAPPAAPPSPPASTGAATPAEPTVPVSQLKAVIGEVFGEFRNGLFADLRKSGALGKEKPAEPSQQPQPQSLSVAAPASSGLSADDVQSMMLQERVFARAEAEHKLTDTQVEWMRTALKGVPAGELTTKASAFLRSMGIAKGASEPSTQPPAAAPVQSTTPPISDKGAPSPGGVTAWQRELTENPLGMSPAAVTAMMSELGADVARKKIVEAGMRQAERIRLSVKASR